ncbi:MAG: DUF2510 domain-containing protein [Actinomycetes bacterium]
MADELEYQYRYPADVAYAAALTVATYSKVTLDSADAESRTVHVSTGISTQTYGENITITVLPEGSDESIVRIHSSLKFGLTAWGANRRNVQRLHAAIIGYLTIVATGTPGWFADPFALVLQRYFDGVCFLDVQGSRMVPLGAMPGPPGPATGTPAGWYVVAPHVLRYWDGQSWTDNTAPR